MSVIGDIPFDNDDNKFRKKPTMKWTISSSKLLLQQKFHHFKLQVYNRDKLTLLKLILFIFVSLFIICWQSTKESTPYVYGHKKIRNYFDIQNTHYHDLLNNKITKQHDNIGFGVTNLEKIRDKPGAPVKLADPGIFQQDETTLEINRKSLHKTGIFKTSKPKRKIYIILGKSPEVGIRHQKSKESWLMEKLSILNKKNYSEKHGYELILVNSLNDNIGLYQKRYQHEYREGWEKFDILRRIMKSNTIEDPKVEEWYWYLDIHTLIMEPENSIDEIIFKNEDYFYRDLQYFNPHNLIVDEELNQFLLGSTLKETASLNSVDLLLTQDCNGINLNSFLIKKSDWSNLLLDLLWDPVFYQQMHAQWAKTQNGKKQGFTLKKDDYDINGYNNDLEEKNCLEYLFNTQNWVRSKIGFMPIRTFNSLSKDFCSEETDDLEDEYGMLDVYGPSKKPTQDYLDDKSNFHYNETNRDFLINYMNCEKHHNCWDRFLEFSGLYEDLHKSWYKKFF